LSDFVGQRRRAWFESVFSGNRPIPLPNMQVIWLLMFREFPSLLRESVCIVAAHFSQGKPKRSRECRLQIDVSC
jgi:hypothetical protein